MKGRFEASLVASASILTDNRKGCMNTARSQTGLRGVDLLQTPLLNKGTAFTEAERETLAVAVLPAAKGMFPEDHPAFTGIYWGPVSSPGVAGTVESAAAYLFAGAILSDYATTGYSALIDPTKMLLANPNDVRLPDASYSNVSLAEFLESLAEKVRAEYDFARRIQPDSRVRRSATRPGPFRSVDDSNAEFQGPVAPRRRDDPAGGDRRLLVQRPDARAALGLPLQDPVPGRLDRLVGPRHAGLRAGLRDPTRVDRDDRRRLIPAHRAGGLDDDPVRDEADHRAGQQPRLHDRGGDPRRPV